MASDPTAPIVVYISHSDEDDLLSLRCEICNHHVPEYAMISKNTVDWNVQLSPWAACQIAKGVGPFAGRADAFIKSLETEITQTIVDCKLNPSAVYISGYSLAGLFALYALYKTDIFDGAACCSGSLWYHEFTNFAKENTFKRKPSKLYLSLGDQEAKVKNPIFATVEDKTKEVYEFYKAQGINVHFEMNEGNHMADVDKRVAKGIAYLLKDAEKEALLGTKE